MRWLLGLAVCAALAAAQEEGAPKGPKVTDKVGFPPLSQNLPL